MRYLLTILALTTVLISWADERSKAEMEEIALQQLNKSTGSIGRRAGSMGSQAMGVSLLSETETYHIYGSKGSEGFVVVSCDDSFTPVLGYSESSFNEENMPEGLAWWLKEIDRSMKWRKTTGNATPAVDYTPTPNFISTTWGQTAPYNNLCPIQNTKRTLTGCVATAMAQVLNYYKFPKQAVGDGSYYLCDPTTGAALPSDENPKYYPSQLSTTYQWDNMLNSYSNSLFETQAQKTAVAQLMRDCGYASTMGYSTNFSGTNYYYAASGLITNFGFNESYVAIAERNYYSDQEWMTLIYHELASKRPVLYSGTDSINGGHSFVFSGIDNDGKVYVNWGWNGQADGFYDISDMAPTNIQGYIGTDHFNSRNIIIYHLHPTPQKMGMQRMPMSQFCVWSEDDEQSYTITASYYGRVNVSTTGTGSGLLNHHYLPFTGTLDLCLFDADNQLARQVTVYNISEEVPAYNGFALKSRSINLSQLADGTYTAYLGTQRTGDDKIAPIRCGGGPIVYTLKKQGSTITLSDKRTIVDTGIDHITSQSTQAQPTRYFNLNGHQLDTPQKGMNIIRQSDGTVKKVIVK